MYWRVGILKCRQTGYQGERFSSCSTGGEVGEIINVKSPQMLSYSQKNVNRNNHTPQPLNIGFKTVGINRHYQRKFERYH